MTRHANRRLEAIDDTPRERSLELDQVDDFLDEAIGRHLLNLDVGLPMAELSPVVRGALGEEDFDTTVVLDAVNRRGRRISVEVRCGSLRSPSGTVQGCLLIMDSGESGE